MNNWKIEYWCTDSGKSPIKKWLDGLTKEQFISITLELTLLEKSGIDLKLPHSRSLGKGLFELRERKFGYRVYYCFKGNKLIILIAAGDKASQKNDITMARKRLANDK